MHVDTQLGFDFALPSGSQGFHKTDSYIRRESEAGASVLLSAFALPPADWEQFSESATARAERRDCYCPKAIRSTPGLLEYPRDE